MSVEIKLNGDKYQFPTEASELTLKQFFELRGAKNIVDEICAVTGIDKMTIENFKNPQTLASAMTLMNVLALSIKSFKAPVLPDYVYIGLKKIKVPKQLNLEPIGAFMSVNDILAEQTVKTELAKAEPDFTDVIPRVLSHYFFIHVFPGMQYSDERAESPEYMRDIMNMRFVDAVPIGNFFFLKFPHLV